MAREKTELAKTPESGMMARPDYIPSSTAGREHITRQDMLMPRIGIAQQMSPQLVKTNEKFIEGLQQGDMFNMATGEIIGTGPIDFFILQAGKPHYIEFYPRESGGGIKDGNVPPSDPRTQFGPDGRKPIATKFYDYVILQAPLRPDLSSALALSMSGSKIKVAQKLNLYISQRGAAVYAGRYRIKTVTVQGQKGTYFNFLVENAGWATPEELKVLEKLHTEVSLKNVVIEREPGDDNEESDM